MNHVFVDPGAMRFVSRIILFPNGVALNVNSHHQRKGKDGWEDAEEPTVLSRAKLEEDDLGKAIQARFEQMSER